MNLAQESSNTYRDFDLEKDILFFKVGQRGLVSFHGKNFNVTKRMSSEQLQRIVKNTLFLKVNTECYANLQKIATVSKGKVLFETLSHLHKSVAITKLRQYALLEMLESQNQRNRLQ